MLSIGLMSGTSMDGIDAALLETDGTPLLLKEQGSASLVYDPRFSLLLKATEYAVREHQGDLKKTQKDFFALIQQYCEMQKIKYSTLATYFPETKIITYDLIARHSTDLHQKLIETLLQKTAYQAKDIAVIGYHGQTLFHRPEQKCSIMLGEPQYLADRLGIAVIYDFRRNDIEAGGQGAPFAPLYHQALAVRDGYCPAAVVNCGGIANITLISGEKETQVMGFDTGPGNALIDTLIRHRTQGCEQMDRNGQYGKRGKVNKKVWEALYEKAVIKNNKNYFSQKPPKSLDYGDMILVPELENLSLEDACATLEFFTAQTIIDSLQWVEAVPAHWILAGGGWKNPVICEALATGLHARYGDHIVIKTADEVGWNAQALEAQIFAYFAVRSLLNRPISFPATTQVPYPMQGGELFQPAI